MNGDRDERLGRLGEELAAAIAAGETVAPGVFAARFDVDEAAVAHCLRALTALDTSLGEEGATGRPELRLPTLPDDFEVRGELGRGGMGVVYRARQRSLDREVAVKVLRPEDVGFGDALPRFRAEARSLARLRHRHIVAVHDSGETAEGLVWFAMDLIEGHTLAEELRRRGRMLPSRAIKVILQVASAIAYAHAQGIVHRDLKPQNVLLDRHGDAFVVDFGLARDATHGGARTFSGELLGTPAYMSPEQVRGDAGRADEAVDVWALGALLHELLTGRGPFSGRPLHETLHAIVHDEPPPFDRRLPAELGVVCAHALQKRAADRYPTALAFAEDVERFADGRGVLARRPRAWRRAWRALRLRWRVAAALASAVLITLLLASWWWSNARLDQTRQQARDLLARGHAQAAADVLQPLLAQVRDWERRNPLELDLARAHNDRAGELLLAGELEAAAATALAALELTGRRVHGGGVIAADQWAGHQRWRWEHARATALSGGERGDVPIDRHRWLDDLRSGLAGRAAAARHVAARGFVDVAATTDEERCALLTDCLRNAVATQPSAADRSALQFPWRWTGAELDAWWTPALEDHLAELAVADGDAALRSLALRTWQQFVGIPTEIALPAAAQVEAWRGWLAAPREHACRQRVQLLVQAIDSAEPEVAEELLAAVRAWSGSPEVADAAAFRAWWTNAVDRPFAAVLREALRLPPDAELSLPEALDRSATTDRAAACAWRQLAWLQVPAGRRLLQCAPAVGAGGHRWRSSCLAAAELSDPRRLTLRAALLRFDDGAVSPELVAQHREVVRIGDEFNVHLQPQLVDTSGWSLRAVGSDESTRRQYLGANEQDGLPPAPALGALSAFCAGEVGLGALQPFVDCRDGVRSLRAELPHFAGAERVPGVARIHVGTAAAVAHLTVRWGLQPQLTTLVFLVGLEEGEGSATTDLPWWRLAVQRSFDAATGIGVARDAHELADWATASTWPMPGAYGAMVALAGTGMAPRGEIRIALMLAGPWVHGLDVFPPSDLTIALPLVTLAGGSVSQPVRERAMSRLEELPAASLTPRLAATLRTAVTATSSPLPAGLASRVAALPEPGTPGDWLRRGAVWRALVLLGLLAFLLRRQLCTVMAGTRRAAIWIASLALSLLFVRVEWNGILLTPTFVPLAIAFAAVWFAGGRACWQRTVSRSLLAVLTLTWALLWLLPRAPLVEPTLSVVAIWLAVVAVKPAAVGPRPAPTRLERLRRRARQA